MELERAFVELSFTERKQIGKNSQLKERFGRRFRVQLISSFVIEILSGHRKSGNFEIRDL